MDRLRTVPVQSPKSAPSNEAPSTMGRDDRSQRSIRFCGPARLLAKPDPVEESPQTTATFDGTSRSGQCSRPWSFPYSSWRVYRRPRCLRMNERNLQKTEKVLVSVQRFYES